MNSSFGPKWFLFRHGESMRVLLNPHFRSSGEIVGAEFLVDDLRRIAAVKAPRTAGNPIRVVGVNADALEDRDLRIRDWVSRDVLLLCGCSHEGLLSAIPVAWSWMAGGRLLVDITLWTVFAHKIENQRSDLSHVIAPKSTPLGTAETFRR